MKFPCKPGSVLAIAIVCAVVGRGQTRVDLRGQTRNVDFSGASSTRTFQAGIVLPAGCVAGETFFKLDAPPGQNFYGCVSAGVWSLQSGGGLPTGVAGQILRWQNGAWSSSPESVSSFSGRFGAIIPQTGDYSFAQLSGIASMSQGGTGAGTAAGARANLGVAAAVHIHSLADLDGIDGKQGTASTMQMFGGGGAAPGDCATFDANGNVVSTGAPCISSATNYSLTFTSAVSVPLNHNLGTTQVLLHCYSADNAGIEYDSLTLSDSNTAVVTFATPQSGTCVVNGSSAGPGSGNVSNIGPLPSDLPVFGDGGASVKAGGRTGTGTQVVMSQSPTIVTPTIASFASATHDHSGMAGGGQLPAAAIAGEARNGNGAKIQMFTGGAPSTDDCAKFDAAGNLVSAGAPCGSGGSGGTVTAGQGLTGDGSSEDPLEIDPAAVPTRISGIATLTFSSVAQSACNEQTISVSGAATGDEVMIGAPSDIDQGFLWSARVSIANTVAVRLCKITSGTIAPVVRSWRATIVRSF
jgi:hypothetical protein